MAHDFAKQSVVCYTLCRRCRENAVAAGEGKGIFTAGKQGFVWGWEAGNKGLVSAADRAYMKALVHRPQPMGQNVPNL